ncbi:MAG TPA: bifunctional homocysteine S-methyltransferase/methylenetetrahydrofolate reductase [Thermoanaerobaculia bacterium]|nr:bifunctional homocysteine S-methyltransferase/methylenetetrahydrofolate reductase [Thermoanaerobaculia bacterium]
MLKDFRKALAEEILLADGAMGTLLVSRGASPDQAKSPLNLTDPESVREAHDDYRDVGARILTTNTWDANRVKLTAHEWGDSLEKINREGVRIAREAVAGEIVFVAGSVGPLGALVKPYGSLTLVQVREIFEEQIRALLEAGVDLLMLETFGSLLEAAEAVRAARGLSGEIPIVAEMTFLSDGRTAFGESAPHALATLALAGADAVGMNCTLGPQETHDVFVRLPNSIAVPLSVMPNAGYPTLVHGRNVYLSSPDYLRDYARAFAEAGAAIIGGCCGTTPEHIRAMANAISGASRAPAGARVSVALEGPAHRVAETAIETSRFKRKLADPEEFVVTLEIEPPRGVDVSAAIEGARAAKTCGVDAVNVTDNPMARLRMSSIAVAAVVQRETGQEAVVQITTRDRNVLGLQSDLLGAAGLSLKAILCLGGDPLKIGDYPQAKQVSEVDVLGLLRIAKGLNSGADLAGNAIGAPTAFAIGCAANPAASDLEVEFSKIRAKVEAGASFAQTQPVYDVHALEAFFGHPEARAIPMLIGLIPLRSLKQTLFFANEVPGIVVPESIIERMRRANERGAEHERAEGLEIARELAAAIAGIARGLHLMPMGKYALAAEILDALPRRETRTQIGGK